MSVLNASLSLSLIRERFRDTAPGDDPTKVALPRGARSWPAAVRRQLSTDLKPAGVLIPITERASGLSVLLTERSAELTLHAGQVSFPGGRMEPDDPDIRHTALREAHEEVGIPPDRVEVAGYLKAMPTITGYAVTPVIGIVDAGQPLTLDPIEVEVAFEVPLKFLLDPANERAAMREVGGVPVPIVEFRYGGHRIWGATGSMLVALRNFLFL